MRNKRLGCTGEWRTEARSRAFFTFCSERFRSTQSCLVFAKNFSSSSVRSVAVDLGDVDDWICDELLLLVVLVLWRVIWMVDGVNALAVGIARRRNADVSFMFVV